MSRQEESNPLPGVYIKTFGCQMNEYDSQKMFSLLSNSHRRVETEEDAEVIIVNTCSVREKAEHKLYSLLGRLRDLKDKRPELVIGVSGCVAQQEGINIVKRNKAVDFVIGTHNLSLVPSLVQSARTDLEAQVAIDYKDEWEDIPQQFDAYAPAHSESIAENAFGTYGTPVRALVAIQRGCNKHCSFCVVPTTRGPEVSRNPEEIERELKLKVNLGAREVLLLGQTVNSYGRDLNPRYPFEKLIRKLAKIENLKRIRFTSPHPVDVRPGLIELYAEEPKLCRHIHLPLQSGSNRILKLMNRNYKVERYLEIVSSLREKYRDISITSDIIVGFPTETDEDFALTLSVVQKAQFTSTFSFIYSERPNTRAREMFNGDDLVDLGKAKERLRILQALQAKISGKINIKTVGKDKEVLIESKKNGVYRGRTVENVPIEATGAGVELGVIASVRVKEATPNLLSGVIR